jgi:hypothetical protein
MPDGERRTAWRWLVPCLIAGTLGPGCNIGERPRAIISPDHLRRQIEDLRGLIAAAKAGELLPDDRLLVAVDEETVRRFARLGLPRDQVVAGTGGRLRVRIEDVDVEFRDGHGLVRLEGTVYRASGPPTEVFAELSVLGRVDGVEVDETGSLRGRATLVGLEVKRVGLFGESTLRRQLLEGLARLNPQVLSLLSESLVLPVRLEREVRIRGTGDEGPVLIEPAQFPLSARVTDLMAFDRRLWVILDVDAGDWRPIDEGAEPLEGEG